MTFAGLDDAQERANLMAYLNAQGSNLPLPAAPAAAPAEGAASADAAAAPTEGAAAVEGATPAAAASAPAPK
jgi:cytochrome c